MCCGGPALLSARPQRLQARDYVPKAGVNRVIENAKHDWGAESRTDRGPGGSIVDHTHEFANHALVGSHQEVFEFYKNGFDSFAKAPNGSRMLVESLREPIRVGTEWTARDQREKCELRIVSIGDLNTPAGVLKNVVTVRISGFHLHKTLQPTIYKYYAPGLGIIRIERYNPKTKHNDLVQELRAFE